MAARWLKPLAVLSLFALGLGPRSAAAQASIAGRVTAITGEPIADARILLVGTTISTVSGQDGRYALRGVPTGPQIVRVLRVGYVEQRRATTVGANAQVGIDFTLERSVVQLEEIVSTATGSRPREELGNAVASFSAAKITETAPITNIQDVLAARVPGVTVQTGSQTGSGGRVRIRGHSSLNLANDPIYIIDGIRMTSNTGSSNLFTGGSQPNRVNDLNPDEIENIEIVKGPSAAALYGTSAANGVILVTTKRGRAGSARWSTWAEGGIIKDFSNYPFNYTIAGHSPGATAYRECTLSVIASGTCLRDSVRIYSPLHDSDVSPVGTGDRNQIGVSVSGGSEVLKYYLSGEREEETGVLQLPPAERRRMEAEGTTIRSHTARPNTLTRYSTRANLNASPTPQLDLSISSGLSSGTTYFATESNATVGIGSHIFGGPGYKTNGTVSGTGAAVPPPKLGYRAWTPGYTFQEMNRQRVTRIITSGSADWRPLSWMQNRATIGVDYTNRLDLNLNRRGEGAPINSTYRLGFAEDNRTAIANFSVDLGSSSTWHARESLSLRSTLGAQYVNYSFEQNNALGEELSPGSQTPNAGSDQSASSNASYSKTLGAFIEEQLSYRDRLFVTGAVRTDQNSAFGTKFQRVFYPKFSMSWIASDEEFFPIIGWMDHLRLRAAYGKSGVQPEPNDALRSFDGTLTNYRGTDLPAVIYTAVGNNLLRPEQTSEIEAGFDLRLLRRANFEFTFYNKDTKDALISAIIPPSAGAATSVRRNLGSVRNTGFEVLLSTQIVDRPTFAADIAFTASTNENELESMGFDATGKELPPVIQTTWRAQKGYPLFGLWARPITGWQDKDANGIITYNSDPALNEIFVGDTAEFRGYSSPRHTATLLPGIDLFRRRLRIASLFEYKGGYKYYNNTERIRCASRNNCNGLMNPSASFEEQAMAVAHLVHPSRTLDGFFQPGSHIRWREVSATFAVPEDFAVRYMRSKRANVNFAARNLKRWTDYRGLDPEIDFTAGSSSNAPPNEFQTLGMPTYFILRLDLGF